MFLSAFQIKNTHVSMIFDYFFDIFCDNLGVLLSLLDEHFNNQKLKLFENRKYCSRT